MKLHGISVAMAAIALAALPVRGKKIPPEFRSTFESKTRWTYPDLTVIFVSGRVTQVEFCARLDRARTGMLEPTTRTSWATPSHACLP